MEQRVPSRRRTITAIVVYLLLFVFILLISNIQEVSGWFKKLLAILRPVTIGLVIAYVVNPFFRFFERKLLVRIRNVSIRRALALLLTYLLLILAVALLLIGILPQLIRSAQSFMREFSPNLSRLLSPVNRWIESLNTKIPLREDGSSAIPTISEHRISDAVNKLWEAIVNRLTKWIGVSDITDIPKLFSILSRAASGLTTAMFGLFLSIYLLASKEKRYAQIMKFRRAFFSDSANRHITNICTVAERSFGSFLRGKILDALIVGGLTYVVCLIFRIPYAVSVAAVIGLANIIPVIGPFVGAIPMALVILLSDPVKVIFFTVGIIVIQQVNDRLISPKIIGEPTGISSLTVLISIILMGSLWGLFGMLIGVPLFATVLELLDSVIGRRLEMRGLPESTDEYYSSDTIAHLSVSAKDRRLARREAKRRAMLERETGSGDLNEKEKDLVAACYAARLALLYEGVNDESLECFRSAWEADRAVPLADNPAEAGEDVSEVLTEDAPEVLTEELPKEVQESPAKPDAPESAAEAAEESASPDGKGGQDDA